MSAAILALPLDPGLRRALDRLQSLHDGDPGVAEITAATETVSSRRTRRSALRVLLQLGALRPTLRELLHDADAEIAFEACRGLAIAGSQADQSNTRLRVAELLPRLPSLLLGETEELLAEHSPAAPAGRAGH